MRKILSIDGGGIKGIFSASFLAEIEEKCGGPYSEYFDMIAGTSTGAQCSCIEHWNTCARDIELIFEKRQRDISERFNSF